MFDAHLLKVPISTPGDTGEEVDAVTRALHDWNADRAEAATAILLPRFWKAHAVPSAGGSGQTVIDSQLVDDADIVIAIFDSRLGQATDDAVSGTAHEIQRSIDSGKPVHVWFSNEPLPNDVDIDELQRLRDFKKDMEAKALLGDYLSPSDPIFKVRSAIEKDVHDMGLSSASIARRDEHAMPRLTVREVNGRDRLFLENKSQTVTAEQLTLDLSLNPPT